MRHETFFFYLGIFGYIVLSPSLYSCFNISEDEDTGVKFKKFRSMVEMYDYVSTTDDFYDTDIDLEHQNSLRSGNWCNFRLLQTLECY